MALGPLSVPQVTALEHKKGKRKIHLHGFTELESHLDYFCHDCVQAKHDGVNNVIKSNKGKRKVWDSWCVGFGGTECGTVSFLLEKSLCPQSSAPTSRKFHEAHF